MGCGFSCNVPSISPANGLNNQSGTDFFHPVMQFTAVSSGPMGISSISKIFPVSISCCKFKSGNAGFCFAIHDCPVDGCGAAILGQE